jgi:hypothetical protein
MTHFDHLLNAFEQASQADNPAKEGYAEKRRALLAYVRELESYKQDAERYRWLRGTVPESSSRWARWRLECWISGAWHELRGLHLDTCIDAARKGEGEEC